MKFSEDLLSLGERKLKIDQELAILEPIKVTQNTSRWQGKNQNNMYLLTYLCT